MPFEAPPSLIVSISIQSVDLSSKKKPLKGAERYLKALLSSLNAIVRFVNVLHLKIHSCVSVGRTELDHVWAIVAFTNWETMDANFFFTAA